MSSRDAGRDVSRRSFLQTSSAVVAGASALGAMPSKLFARTAPADTVRVGLIGCGGRGSGAATDIVASSPGVELVAMGDLFEDRLDKARATLKEALKDAFKVDDSSAFTGFDAYEKVIGFDLDLVILTTPPGFRPIHLAKAIDAGKHVFMEKPVAVDPAGVRAVIAASRAAKEKKLAIVAGTQRRHDPKYIETMRRIHDGAIGEIVAGSVYWNQGGLWKADRKPGMSDTEWQIRNWLYFTWLSGDHVVEQHLHNLDVANWAMNAHPVRANGVGGRQVRVDPAYGNVFDHFAVELEYPSGARILSMCRQQDGTARFVGEHFIGSAGTSDGSSWIKGGKSEWKWEAPGEPVNPYVQEHADLVASIRAGTPLNEGERVAESTLTAIMVREAAYTGQELSWDEVMNAELSLMPPDLAFGELTIAPVAAPGVTRLARQALAQG